MARLGNEKLSQNNINNSHRFFKEFLRFIKDSGFYAVYRKNILEEPRFDEWQFFKYLKNYRFGYSYKRKDDFIINAFDFSEAKYPSNYKEYGYHYLVDFWFDLSDEWLSRANKLKRKSRTKK